MASIFVGTMRLNSQHFVSLVRNVIVFFYGYVYEGYYENDVNRYFDYLSGYADNSTTRLSHLMTHPEGELRLCPNGSNRRQRCWVVEVGNYEGDGKKRDIKD